MGESKTRSGKRHKTIAQELEYTLKKAIFPENLSITFGPDKMQSIAIPDIVREIGKYLNISDIVNIKNTAKYLQSSVNKNIISKHLDFKNAPEISASAVLSYPEYTLDDYTMWSIENPAAAKVFTTGLIRQGRLEELETFLDTVTQQYDYRSEVAVALSKHMISLDLDTLESIDLTIQPKFLEILARFIQYNPKLYLCFATNWLERVYSGDCFQYWDRFYANSRVVQYDPKNDGIYDPSFSEKAEIIRFACSRFSNDHFERFMNSDFVDMVFYLEQNPRCDEDQKVFDKVIASQARDLHFYNMKTIIDDERYNPSMSYLEEGYFLSNDYILFKIGKMNPKMKLLIDDMLSYHNQAEEEEYYSDYDEEEGDEEEEERYD